MLVYGFQPSSNMSPSISRKLSASVSAARSHTLSGRAVWLPASGNVDVLSSGEIRPDVAQRSTQD